MHETTEMHAWPRGWAALSRKKHGYREEQIEIGGTRNHTERNILTRRCALDSLLIRIPNKIHPAGLLFLLSVCHWLCWLVAGLPSIYTVVA
jgi:hypothetical protein